MQQREIQDSENVKWTCVQSMTPIGSLKGKHENGKVIVVCTPSGGAQTVRLELPIDWFSSLSDEELLKRISNARA